MTEPHCHTTVTPEASGASLGAALWSSQATMDSVPADRLVIERGEEPMSSTSMVGGCWTWVRACGTATLVTVATRSQTRRERR